MQLMYMFVYVDINNKIIIILLYYLVNNIKWLLFQ